MKVADLWCIYSHMTNEIPFVFVLNSSAQSKMAELLKENLSNKQRYAVVPLSRALVWLKMPTSEIGYYGAGNSLTRQGHLRQHSALARNPLAYDGLFDSESFVED